MSKSNFVFLVEYGLYEARIAECNQMMQDFAELNQK